MKMMFLAKTIAEMYMSVSKHLENSVFDDKNHISQVRNLTVRCLANGYNFFEYISTHSMLAQWNQ